LELSKLDISDWKINGKSVKRVEDFCGNQFIDYLTPNSRTASNVNSELVIVLQDWASTDAFPRLSLNTNVMKYGYDPELKTNIRLHRLLIKYFKHLFIVDYDLFRSSIEKTFSKIYITNVFQFVKPGSMSANIPVKYLRKTAEFTMKEIEIIQPRFVICLGSKVFHCLTGKNDKANHEISGIKYFHQYHPAARIGTLQVEQSWKAMMDSMRH